MGNMNIHYFKMTRGETEIERERVKTHREREKTRTDERIRKPLSRKSGLFITQPS